MTAHSVSIVIPIYNHFSLVHDLLLSLVNRTAPQEIIVVDDYSNDKATLDGLAWWKHNYGIDVIRPVENLGFLRASNYGMSKAHGEILCLLSSDVIVEDDLCRLIEVAIEENPKRLVGGIVYNGSTGWNLFGGKVFPYAEGWLLACTKENWKMLGGFDVRYAPYDFEDVDLSTKALQEGMTLYSLNNPNIRHIGAQTIGYNEQRTEQTERNRRKFEEKWITMSSATS